MRKIIAVLNIFLLLCNSSIVYAQAIQPGIVNAAYVLNPSTRFYPALIKGIKTFTDDPLKMDFIIDRGDGLFNGAAFKEEADRMIKYFLSALTIPDKDIWVNLSPYEKNRMIPSNFSRTQMGDELLEQDYLLKRLVSSLMYPDSPQGKAYWASTNSDEKNLLAKVWIIPDKITVYEYAGGAYVDQVHLKVLMQDDYLAQSQSKMAVPDNDIVGDDVNAFKAHILPMIEKEVNEGKNFFRLRQMVNAMALATWYKQRLKESWLAQVYADKSRTSGVDSMDKAADDRIYAQYLEVFQKGVFNYIEKKYDSVSRRITQRRYFSGGFARGNEPLNIVEANSPQEVKVGGNGPVDVVGIEIDSSADNTGNRVLSSAGRMVSGHLLTSKQIIDQVESIKSSMGSGVLVPISALPTPEGSPEYGMGDIGPAARKMAKDLASAGQKYWLTLPPHPAGNAGNCSYASESNFALEPNLISPDDMIRDGWITREEVDNLLDEAANQERIDLDIKVKEGSISQEKRDEILQRPPEFKRDHVALAMLQYKNKLLQNAYARFKDGSKKLRDFEEFKRIEGKAWLNDYAVYLVIAREHGNDWTKWPEELRKHDALAIEEFSALHSDAIEGEKFAQCLTQEYFLDYIDYVQASGLTPIGDVPIYPGLSSCDVWANQDVFLLKENGDKKFESGCGPDFFNAEGQGWGHPMYNWDNPRILDYMSARYRRFFRLYGGKRFRENQKTEKPKAKARVDHMIGLFDPWAIPAGKKPLDGGRYRGTVGEGKYLGVALFERLEHDMPGSVSNILAEDLGMITPVVQDGMAHFNMPGMVFLYGMTEKSPAELLDSVHSPYNRHGNNMVVTTNHDGPATRGRFLLPEGDESSEDVNKKYDDYREYLRMSGYDGVTHENIAQVATRFVMDQRQKIALHWIGDMVTTDSGNMGLIDARFNFPGTVGEQNWTWRLRNGRFDDAAIARLRKLTEDSNRTPERMLQRLDTVTPYCDSARLALAILVNNVKDHAVVERFVKLLQNGQVRYAPLTDGLLSTVWKEENGDYILLSNTADKGHSSSEEQAVSLLRAFNEYLGGQKVEFLANSNDDALLTQARREAEGCDSRLAELASISSMNELEEIVTFIGSLLDPRFPAESIKDKLHGMEKLETLAQFQRGMFYEQLKEAWTAMWQKYEGRSYDRRVFITEFLSGKLEESPKFNQLRWRVLDAWGRSHTYGLAADGNLGGFRYQDQQTQFKVIKNSTPAATKILKDFQGKPVIIYGFTPRIVTIRSAATFAQALSMFTVDGISVLK